MIMPMITLIKAMMVSNLIVGHRHRYQNDAIWYHELNLKLYQSTIVVLEFNMIISWWSLRKMTFVVSGSDKWWLACRSKEIRTNHCALVKGHIPRSLPTIRSSDHFAIKCIDNSWSYVVCKKGKKHFQEIKNPKTKQGCLPE